MWVPGYVTTAARIRGWTFIVPITCSATCLPFTSNKFICFWRQELLVHLMEVPSSSWLCDSDLLYLLPEPFMGYTQPKASARTMCPQYSSRFHGHTKELVGKRHFPLALKIQDEKAIDSPPSFRTVLVLWHPLSLSFKITAEFSPFCFVFLRQTFTL